ncbi:MAG: Hypothetical protein BHV28_03580 [Candidatus Tokpelaia hoelldobleri]|uniref:Lipoprotein n=1 Tax=Candidatus Tokpelaia hoelldobleri TaxID=1902579 RepID=A0A1U9JT84_9HYPH|nr:MAG: Hypothetical protein BHV28_03580 [Candidatus Tokpelaia hoelldoblerii]
MKIVKKIAGLAVLTLVSGAVLVACGDSDAKKDYAARVERINTEAQKKLPIKMGPVSVTEFNVKDRTLRMKTVIADDDTAQEESATLDRIEHGLTDQGIIRGAVCQLFKLTRKELTELNTLELTYSFRERAKTISLDCQ